MKVGDLVRIKPAFRAIIEDFGPCLCIVTAVFEDDEGMKFCRLHNEYWYKDYELELLSECGRSGQDI